MGDPWQAYSHINEKNSKFLNKGKIAAAGENRRGSDKETDGRIDGQMTLSAKVLHRLMG